jgi:prolyl oligopeptidase
MRNKNKRCWSGILAGACTITACGAALAAMLAPPAAMRGRVTDSIQGVSVADPYRWLEDGKDTRVQAWSDAQNTRTRAYLDGLSDRDAVKTRLRNLIEASSPAFSELTARGPYVFARYTDPKQQQPLLVTLDAKADPSSRHTVIDPNALDAKGLTAIDWFVPSGDGSKVAISLSQNGSEDGTLHVLDVQTGKEIETPIANVQYPTAGGSMAWAADGRGFWYTRYPGPKAPDSEQHFNMQVYFHALGTDSAQDALVLGSAEGLERVSEVFLSNRFNGPDVMAMVQRGDGNIWAFYVLRANAAPLRLATYEDQIVYATLGPDGAVYGISRHESSNGAVVKLRAPFKAGGLAHAAVLVPASEIAIVSGGAELGEDDLAFGKAQLFVRDIIGGPNQVRVFDLEGKSLGRLPLPEVASNTEIECLEGGDVLFDVSTYLKPRYYAAWHPDTGQSGETALRQTSPISYDDAEVVREFAPSHDGTRVPVNVIRKRGTRLDGTNPVLLNGYGGFGVNQSPHFLGSLWRVWMDAGGVVAIANLRGGAEYGEKWHQQGMLTHKQNVFDDFYAAATHLIKRGYTSSSHLSLLGGSNGGLLMGAMITQHPALARAVISAVGIYDMTRVELDPNGSFNVTEFGSVKDPAQFQALYAYSPYHHVKPRTDYPAVLMLTGATDGRVNPMQSRKFIAALQWADPSGHDLLLRTNPNSGHGIGSSLDERIAETTDELTFLFDQLGMRYAAPH